MRTLRAVGRGVFCFLLFYGFEGGHGAVGAGGVLGDGGEHGFARPRPPRVWKRLELLCGLAFPQRLHQGFADDHGQIGAGVAVGVVAELLEVFGRERVRRVAQIELDHSRARGRVRERDVNALFEAATNGGVDLPRDVGRAQHQEPVLLLRDALHLDQELGLDASRGVGFALGAGAAHAVDFVDEDDGVVFCPRQREELLHESLRLALPLAHEVRTGHREELGVRLRRDGLGQETFSRSGRTVQQNAAPRLALADEELRKAHGQNHRFLQRGLGALQARHVAPLDVRLFRHDRARQLAPQFLRFVVVRLSSTFRPISRRRRRSGGRRSQLGVSSLFQHVLQVLGPLHVALDPL
mmetsp:Transcript_13376/g.40498  ORF Transcript_13376/g.40498 Transcript_13376/m.40498 type:complete len:353 (-) Transcript_13376:208-1266(-)